MAPASLKRPRLLQISVTIPAAIEDAVAPLFAIYLREPPVLYTDAESQLTTVSVFLPPPRTFGPRLRQQLKRGLDRLRADGVPLGRAPVRTRHLAACDWAEAWKRHFRPLDIGGRLLVKPTWSRRAPRPGQAVVLLDPGLSFGTGQHPTTAFCLEQVVAQRPEPGQPRSLLDIGTGSGILAIAAARLGYTRVEAFDFDPEAVTVATANAHLNQVAARVRPVKRDLRRLPLLPRRLADVVCANLLADLLLAEPERIIARVAPGGTLVLAGILDLEFDGVVRAYAARGWRLTADRTVREWRSGAFQHEPQAKARRRNRTRRRP